jgi:hypothetical protein
MLNGMKYEVDNSDETDPLDPYKEKFYKNRAFRCANAKNLYFSTKVLLSLININAREASTKFQ